MYIYLPLLHEEEMKYEKFTYKLACMVRMSLNMFPKFKRQSNLYNLSEKLYQLKSFFHSYIIKHVI